MIPFELVVEEKKVKLVPGREYIPGRSCTAEIPAGAFIDRFRQGQSACRAVPDLLCGGRSVTGSVFRRENRKKQVAFAPFRFYSTAETAEGAAENGT